MTAQHIKKQWYGWVIILVILVIIMWFVTWQNEWYQNRQVNNEDRLESTWQDLAKQWQKLQGETNVNSNKVAAILRQWRQQTTNDLGAGEWLNYLSQRIDTWQLADWQEVSMATLNWRMPADWQAQEEDGVILIMNDIAEPVMRIVSLAQASDLPDNINNLTLIDWLDQQQQRALGIVADWQEQSMHDISDGYLVTYKNNDWQTGFWWQMGDGVYHIDATSIIDNNLFSLIISTLNYNNAS